MKLSKFKVTAIALFCSVGFASCAEGTKPKDTGAEKETKEIASDDAQYVKDWEAIKKAIIDKDIPGLGKFAGNDEVDSESLMTYANESHILQVLESYEFKHLKVEEQNGVTYHVFYGYVQLGDDEPKKELSIYMIKGKTNLTIDYFSAKNMD